MGISMRLGQARQRQVLTPTPACKSPPLPGSPASQPVSGSASEVASTPDQAGSVPTSLAILSSPLPFLSWILVADLRDLDQSL